MKEFKDLLREIMEERDLKAVDVSELTGIGSGAVSMYLSGTRTPKVDTIRKLNPCPKMWKNRIGRNVKRKKITAENAKRAS